jgi:hypothetical protein
MIYHFSIGAYKHYNDAENNATIMKDEHDNSFISLNAINQRIRITSGCHSLQSVTSDDFLISSNSFATVNDADILPYMVTKFSLGDALDSEYRWVNNSKNMNPMFISNRKPKDADTKNEQIIAYITLDPRVKVLSYSTKYSILQTYGKKDYYTGCTIVLNRDDITVGEENVLMTIKFVDTTTHRYKVANISIDEAGKPTMNIEDVVGDEVSKMRFNDRKYKSSLRFRYKTKKKQLLTSYYICEKYQEQFVRDLVKDLHNPTVMTVDTPFDESNSNVVDLLNTLSENHVKAITTIGVDIPLDVLKKHKIFNVFEYDIEKEILKCKR